MLATAKNYRENVLAVSNSRMPLERKQTIISGLLEQIALISNGDKMDLPSNVKELSEDERVILQEIYEEVREILDGLTQKAT